MRRMTIAATAALLAASTLALAPAASADTVTGPSGKIQVTTAGAQLGSLFGDLSVYPGANGSREVTMTNASSDTAILTVRAAVPASIDSALAQGLSLCWSGGDRTFGQLAGNDTVIGTALLEPGESTKASFGYRFGEEAKQPAAGASTGFALNFNLRQAAPGEEPGAVDTGGDGCGSASDWEQQPVTDPKPDPAPTEKPAPGDPDTQEPETGKPTPNVPDAPNPIAPGGPGTPDTGQPGTPQPTIPGPPESPESPEQGDPDVETPGGPESTPTAQPQDPEDSTKPGAAGGESTNAPDRAAVSKPEAGTSPVAEMERKAGELVATGADAIAASLLGAVLVGAGAWLIARKRKTAK